MLGLQEHEAEGVVHNTTEIGMNKRQGHTVLRQKNQGSRTGDPDILKTNKAMSMAVPILQLSTMHSSKDFLCL